jgi:DNA-binding YbaB/EbfC family protein
MNMQNLMAQAQRLQKDIERISKEIDEKTFIGENSAIRVEILGTNEIKKLEVLNDEVLTDKELLEDMLLLAVNDGLSKIKKEKDERLGKYTNGLGGLF